MLRRRNKHVPYNQIECLSERLAAGWLRQPWAKLSAASIGITHQVGGAEITSGQNQRASALVEAVA